MATSNGFLVAISLWRLNHRAAWLLLLVYSGICCCLAQGKAPTANSIARIDWTIDKLSLIHLRYEVQSELADETPLLSVQKFGNALGNYYYLNSINNLYAYAYDKGQVTNVSNSYLDTSKLL